MLPDIGNSKEAIKNRMLRHALTYWGIKSTEGLDPAIKLMLEALSSELYSLGNEVKDTQVRILEKIASLLAPGFLTAPNPAHGILHASPVEATELLVNTTAFYAQQKISSNQNEVLDTMLDIFFTPVDAVKLFDIQIAYMASGGNLFSYDGAFSKQLVMRCKTRTGESNTLWLGLRVNPKIEDIQNLFFYFDWKNLDPKLAHHLYQLLPLAKWYINDKHILTGTGLQYYSAQHETDSYENIFLEYDLLCLMEKDIKNHYNQKYITVGSAGAGNLQELKQPFPSSFRNMFAENDLHKLSEKLLWIRITFPAAVQQESLDDIYVYTNAFPVVNRQVNDLKFRLKGGSNIIPLKTGDLDQFLSVKSLSDGTHAYKSVPYRKMEEEQSGTYTLRNGGVERFDARNARDLISYLLELLRSETAAFSAYGYDFIGLTLKEMDQKISLMEQKTKGYINNATEIPNYIIVKPFEGNDMMYAEYWTTLAEAANNLRAGTKLHLGKGVKVKQDSLAFMTTTIGGKNRLRPEERLNAFRYGIMTRNRLVTKEDIRNFCFYELGDRISKVEVERGFEMSGSSKESFRRTIDVVLTPARLDALKNRDWEILCDQLKSKLHSRSGMSSYYRVLLANEEHVS
jgi:hypothetical protein